MAIPTLHTDRLVLRAPVIGDFAAYRALMASDRAIYMGGPFDERSAWGMFASDVAMWTLFGHGCLMIELAQTGQCVGQVGINHGPLFPEKELGWFLYAGFEGRGYASEAALAVRNWAFGSFGLDTLASYVDENNAASIRVAERLGGVRDDAALRQDPEDIVFRYFR